MDRNSRRPNHGGVHSIRADRQASNAEQQKVRTDENNRFDAIAQGLKDSIVASKGQFDTTIGHVDSVLKTTQRVSNLAKDSLENLTGENSVAYLSPQPPTDDGHVPLAIVNAGKFPLTGVTVVVVDSTTYPFKTEPAVIVGTLASHVVRPIDLSVMPIPGSNPPGIASFEISIYAQNGTSRELLQFRRGKKMPWDYRATVSREAPAHRSMIPKHSKAKSDIPGLNLDYGWIEDRKSGPQANEP